MKWTGWQCTDPLDHRKKQSPMATAITRQEKSMFEIYVGITASRATIEVPVRLTTANAVHVRHDEMPLAACPESQHSRYRRVPGHRLGDLAPHP